MSGLPVAVYLCVATIVIALVYSYQKNGTRERFYPYPSGPNTQNNKLTDHNILLYKGLSDVSNDLRREAERTHAIDNALTSTATSNRTRLRDNIMNGPKMRADSPTNVDAYITHGRIHVDNIRNLSRVDPALLNSYNITSDAIINDAQYGNATLMKYISDAVSRRLAGEKVELRDVDRQRVMIAVYNAYVRYMERVPNGYRSDLSSVMTNPNSYAVDQSLLEQLVKKEIQNQYKNPNLQREYRFQVGDYMFFPYIIERTAKTQDICFANQATAAVVVGGKICSIDYVNQTVKLAYSFIMNPNYNPQCVGYPNPTGPAIDYVNEIYPYWVPQCRKNPSTGLCFESTKCNLATSYVSRRFPTLACDAHNTDLNSPSSDNCVRTYIGGLDSGDASGNGRRFQCGVSPTAYKLPESVPFGMLRETVEDCLTMVSINTKRKDTQLV